VLERSNSFDSVPFTCYQSTFVGKHKMAAVPPGLFIFLIIIEGIFYCTCISVYLLRRNKFPIQARLPLIVSIELFTMGSGGLLVLFMGAFPDSVEITDCKRYLAFLAFFDLTALLTVAFRVGWLFIKDFVNRIMAKGNFVGFRQTRQESAPPVQNSLPKEEINCVQRHTETILTHLLKKLSIIQTLTVVFSPAILVAFADIVMVLSATDSAGISILDERCLPDARRNSLMMGSISAYCGALAFLVIFAIMKIEDNFKIGFEIRALLVFVILLATFQGIMSASQSIFIVAFQQTRIWNLMVGGIYIPIVIGFQSLFPMYLSIKHEKNEKEMGNSRNPSVYNKMRSSFGQSNNLVTAEEFPEEELKDFLTHQNGRHALIKFLEAELSVENLIFCEECVSFRTKFTQRKRHEIIEHAQFIRDNFIANFAPSAVNLSSEMYKELMARLSNSHLEAPMGVSSLNPDILEEARIEIMLLMMRDSFPRFRKSPSYARVMKAAECESSVEFTSTVSHFLQSATGLFLSNDKTGSSEKKRDS
jgi:hypothetical protein